jgi:TPR repeat protein
MTRGNQGNAKGSADQLLREAEIKEEQGDFTGAFSIHMTAAKLGSVPSQLAVGNYYSAGRGVQKDLEEASRWYRMVYRSGEYTGAHNLADNLQKQGNRRGAIAWFKRAVAMNDGDACVRLAKIYLEGRNGVKAATDLLRRAISLSRCETSDAAREEATVLLRRLRPAGDRAPGRSG